MSEYSGALSHKRKHEAVEIAEALGIPNPEAKLSDLRDQIQNHLNTNQTTLSVDPRYKGLYVRKRANGSVSPDGEAKSPVTDTTKKIRKSTSKILDAASQALPESPSNLRQVARRVDANVQNALVPAEDLQKDLQVRAQKVSSAIQKFTGERQVYIEKSIGALQKFLSKPEHLITTSIAVELLLIFRNLLQFYDHTLFFPPVGGAKGEFYSLLNTLFGWAPRTTLNLRYPEFRSLFHGEVWTAISWWFFFTVLPPLALSTIVSFQPQKGFFANSSASTKSKQQVARPPVHKADPFAYALFRLAILLFPLTTAAPAHWVDALGASGDAQGRALGAGLLAALIGSERLGAHA